MDFGRLRANVSFPFITHVRLTSGRCRTQTTLDSQAKPEVSGTSYGIAIRGRSHPPLIRRFSFDSIAQKGCGSPQYGQSAGAGPTLRVSRPLNTNAPPTVGSTVAPQLLHRGPKAFGIAPPVRLNQPTFRERGCGTRSKVRSAPRCQLTVDSRTVNVCTIN